MRKYVDALNISLVHINDSEKKTSILGQIGVWLRILGDLESAESSLRQALQIVESGQLGINWEIQQKLRLAHVLQWKGLFDQSNTLFAEAIDKCRTIPEANIYLSFALQHAGKNLFDQNRFQEALEMFNEALKIRKVIAAPINQTQSTELAIAITKSRLGSL